MPRVSVIIPAFRARETLPAALASVAAAGLPPDRVEVVIAPDDGDAYDGLPDHGLRLVRCAPDHVATGAGAARNRALACARGGIVAFLDADDTWAPGYLAALVPLAAGYGVAFGRTRILREGAPLLDLPGHGRDRLALFDLACGASFHPVLARPLAGPFRSMPAQDVLHAMEALSLVGGQAPLGRAVYNLHLNARSATAERGFALRVQGAYARVLRDLERGRTRIRPEDIAPARGVIEAKARLNRAYMRAGAGRSFYEFVGAHLAKGPAPRLKAGSPR